MLTLAEVLVHPYRQHDDVLAKDYETLIQPRESFDLLQVTRSVLREAALSRATQSLRLPDAIHQVTAMQSDCAYFVTGDRKLAKASQVEPVLVALP